MRSITRSRRSGGFTLVELMISITIGGIVIALAYTISASASRAFNNTLKLAQTQASVRSAIGRMRRDIARAGFGSTPNSAVDNGTNPAGCAVSATPTQAVRYGAGAYTSVIAEASANRVRADGLTLEGNFETNDHFLVGAINNGTSVTLQTTRQSFRRTFLIDTDPTGTSNLQLSTERLAEVFPVGRSVQLVSATGRRMIRTVTSAPAQVGATVAFNVTPAISVGCFGYGRGARVTPINRIEYYAATAVSDFPFLVAPGNSAFRQAQGLRNVVLGRREVDAAGNPVVGTQQAILEYLVHVAYSFAYDQRDSAAAVPVVGPFETVPATNTTQLTTRPQRVRAIRVDLAARRPGFTDAIQPLTRSSMDEPLTGYWPTGLDGLPAPVRQVREEIFLENVAARGLQ